MICGERGDLTMGRLFKSARGRVRRGLPSGRVLGEDGVAPGRYWSSLFPLDGGRNRLGDDFGDRLLGRGLGGLLALLDLFQGGSSLRPPLSVVVVFWDQRSRLCAPSATLTALLSTPSLLSVLCCCPRVFLSARAVRISIDSGPCLTVIIEPTGVGCETVGRLV